MEFVPFFWAGRKLHLHTAHERHMCILQIHIISLAQGPTAKIPCQCFDKQQQLPPTQHSAYPHLPAAECKRGAECITRMDGWLVGMVRMVGEPRDLRTDALPRLDRHFHAPCERHTCVLHTLATDRIGWSALDGKTGYADAALEPQRSS